MDWENIPENTEDWFGFVYLIERTVDTDNGKPYRYVGCKMFHSTKKLPPLKKSGLKRKRKVTQDSDWKDYYGSSEQLKKDVEKYGKESYKRTILHLTTCKWENKYVELLEQIKRNVIVDDSYFNGILNLRIGKIPKNLKEKYVNK